jgi:anti-sigma factor RsiW
MNHQPFEEWLLNDKHLDPSEKRELDSHLRVCSHCTALTATGLALRSAHAIRPAAGFTMRFQHKLAAQKIAERRRRLLGLIVLVLCGGALFGWLATPYIRVFSAAPVQAVTLVVGYFLYFSTSVQALGEAILVFARVLPGIIPPYIWMIIVSAMAGFGLLTSVSIWRFTRHPQGVPS